MGNIQTDSLPQMLDRWLESPLAKTIGCHCPAVNCLGPNLLVKDAYYPGDGLHRRGKRLLRIKLNIKRQYCGVTSYSWSCRFFEL